MEYSSAGIMDIFAKVMVLQTLCGGGKVRKATEKEIEEFMNQLHSQFKIFSY